MNYDKQIEYWKCGAEEDLETAGILLEKKKIKEGLFFCHLSIEKVIKAIFVQQNNEPAPKSHNLLYLLSKTDISIKESYEEFLGILMKYQLEGRYPDYILDKPDDEAVNKYFETTKELLDWLMKKL
ncbi:HEPN domain-containing protein [Bacteroidota bacterium]